MTLFVNINQDMISINNEIYLNSFGKDIIDMILKSFLIVA